MRRHLLVVTVALLLVWLLLTDAQPSALLIGLATLALAVWLCVLIQPHPVGAISLRKLISFIPYFVWESLRGGWDVSRRVFRRRMQINSGCIDYPLSLQRQDAQQFFLYCVNLMPGTLTMSWNTDSVQIHLLDASSPPYEELEQLERRVAHLFCQPHPGESNP